MVNKKTCNNCLAPAKLSLSVALALAALGATPAAAIVIDTGNPDAVLRWDNQIRYNLGWRMADINPAFANAYGTDESETRFKKHDLIMNRLDLLSEMDYTVSNNYGFRISAALWSENAYPSTSRTGDLINQTYTGANAVPSNYGPSGQYSPYAKRYVTGSSGEFLDAFVFGGFDLGSTSLKFKLGQHNVYWGEALYTIADGVSAGQGPLDTIKAATSPGAEAKELFMPINQLSVNWSLSNEVTLLGQYQFDWKPYRTVAGGTYFAAADATADPTGAAVCASTGPGICMQGLDAVTPGRKGGNFGLAVRWSPAWLDGTAGLYYRKYDEKLPWSQTQLNGGVAGTADRNKNMGVRLSYARGTEMLGTSLSKSLGPLSTAVELSYRRNTALNTVGGFFVGSQPYTGFDYFFLPAVAGSPNNIPLTQTPTYEQVEGARGNTFHALANLVWLLPKTALWETGNFQAELAYQRLDKVTKNPNVYFSEDYACKFGYGPKSITAGLLNKNYGCSTKDALALSMGFNPQWLQVLPGMDLTMPTSLSYGLKGNSPTLGGSNEGGYKWAIGLTAVYHTLYEFGVMLSDQHQDLNTQVAKESDKAGVAGQTISTPVIPLAYANGGTASLNNRRWLNLRFKTSF